MKRFTLPIILLGLGIGLMAISFYFLTDVDSNAKKTLNQIEAVQKNDTKVNIPEVGGEFNLVDMNNNKVTQELLKNKITLIYFGFTYCPDICPTTLSHIAKAFEGLDAAELEKVQALFVSVDPQRDTAEVLKTYLANFHPKIIGLTGEKANLDDMAKKYKVYYAKVNEEENYLMDHSSMIYVFGPDGKILSYFAKSANSEQIRDEIRHHFNLVK